ncbi:MAG: family 1 encapsulin nanocompartment shell protein [Acidiferrobacteraceae bacterium]
MIDRFLDRDSVSLTSRQWRALDDAVTRTARAALVGRRFIPLFGPLGAGTQAVPLQEFEGTDNGEADYTGEAECGTVRPVSARYLPLPIIHKDFIILWRNAAVADQEAPFDLAPATNAALCAARKEDDLIFNGDAALGLDGLLTVAGRSELPRSDWQQVGNAFKDVMAALTRLASDGFYGPYALVVPPPLYARMHGVHERTGVLEIRNIEELTTGGVFRSPALSESRALVVATGPQNADLAVAQDFTVAALGPDRMNIHLRVFEIAALRIKRPKAIVLLEGASK